MERLLEKRVETTWNIEEDKNRQRSSIHQQGVEEENRRKRNQTRHNDDISPIGEWKNRTSKQGGKKVPKKIYIIQHRGLAKSPTTSGIQLQYKTKGRKYVYTIPNSVRGNTRDKRQETNAKNKSRGERGTE
jgi:hypothetical protein